MAGKVVTVLVLLLATAGADELATARKLLRAKNPDSRLHGVELLIRIDSRRSVEMLEQAIEKANLDMERNSKKLDELLARQLALLPALRKVIRRLKQGRNSAIDDAEALIAKCDRLEREVEDGQRQLRGNLKIVSAGGFGFRAFRDAKAIKKIEDNALRETNPTVRLFYIAGLRDATRKRSVPVLLKLLEQRDPRVRAAAVRSLIPFAREEGVAASVATLAGDDAWPVRLGAFQAMTGAPFATAVEFLVEAAVRERGEMEQAADSYLYHLTGTSFFQDPNHWRHWWKKNKHAVEAGTWTPAAPEELPPDRTVASFFRIPLQSERILFALDFSGSMAEPLTLKDKQIERLLNEQGLAHTRLGYAQAEFIRAITAMPDGAYFDVLGYNDDVKRIRPRLIKLDKSSRRRAIRWVLKLETAELTNIWGALHETFRDYLSSGGGRRVEELPDTVVFLTDGIATRGRFTDTKDLRTLVRMWNQPLDVVFHCVGIGKGHDRQLLKGLAEDTGGYYVDVTAGLQKLERRRRAAPPGLVTADDRREASKEQLDKLLTLLDDGDDDERIEACRKLGAMGPGAAAACEALAEELSDLSANVQEAAADALAAIGPKAVPYLIEVFEVDDADGIANASNALAKIGPAAKAALPHLEKLKDHGDSRARDAVRKAIETLTS